MGYNNKAVTVTLESEEIGTAKKALYSVALRQVSDPPLIKGVRVKLTARLS